MDKVRLDRFLWASRFYKTRSLSTDACRRNWISVNDLTAKPSKEVRIGDIIKIKKFKQIYHKWKKNRINLTT